MKTEEAKKRKLMDESHGAEEPVWKLKVDAHNARKKLREAVRLAKQLDSVVMEWHQLTWHDRQLLEDFHARRLHTRVDRANLKYGQGIARTHDFGFRPGDNMCTDVPIEVQAQLRVLKQI